MSTRRKLVWNLRLETGSEETNRIMTDQREGISIPEFTSEGQILIYLIFPSVKPFYWQICFTSKSETVLLVFITEDYSLNWMYCVHGETFAYLQNVCARICTFMWTPSTHSWTSCKIIEYWNYKNFQEPLDLYLVTQ